MKLSEIHTEWSVDCKMDTTDLVHENARIPLLHSKYLQMFSEERIRYKIMTEGKKKLIQKLEDYYNGKIDGKAIGREAWQLTESKTLTEKRIDNDQELIDYNIKLYQQEEKVNVLKEIVTSINYRVNNVGNAGKMIVFNRGTFD